ncbi:hypothetical protein BD311DRAFT_843501 [Dichomitus squalens]|uniref:Uncharacterized protein n=1 Tax=Dichomitus squalens TaxID=114155 RepID=A0A4Q9MN97_9APHY|nr:hypothetical protein BD311DRAFT_843501 [Dichomitus squalens]
MRSGGSRRDTRYQTASIRSGKLAAYVRGAKLAIARRAGANDTVGRNFLGGAENARSPLHMASVSVNMRPLPGLVLSSSVHISVSLNKPSCTGKWLRDQKCHSWCIRVPRSRRNTSQDNARASRQIPLTSSQNRPPCTHNASFTSSPDRSLADISTRPSARDTDERQMTNACRSHARGRKMRVPTHLPASDTCATPPNPRDIDQDTVERWGESDCSGSRPSPRGVAWGWQACRLPVTPAWTTLLSHTNCVPWLYFVYYAERADREYDGGLLHDLSTPGAPE